MTSWMLGRPRKCPQMQLCPAIYTNGITQVAGRAHAGDLAAAPAVEGSTIIADLDAWKGSGLPLHPAADSALPADIVRAS